MSHTQDLRADQHDQVVPWRESQACCAPEERAGRNGNGLSRLLQFGMVGGTAGSDAKASQGIKILREIDSILSHVYRNDPALLASWMSACHVDRDPSRAEEDEEPAPGAPAAPEPLAVGFTAKGAARKKR